MKSINQEAWSMTYAENTSVIVRLAIRSKLTMGVSDAKITPLSSMQYMLEYELTEPVYVEPVKMTSKVKERVELAIKKALEHCHSFSYDSCSILNDRVSIIMLRKIEGGKKPMSKIMKSYQGSSIQDAMSKVAEDALLLSADNDIHMAYVVNYTNINPSSLKNQVVCEATFLSRDQCRLLDRVTDWNFKMPIDALVRLYGSKSKVIS